MARPIARGHRTLPQAAVQVDSWLIASGTLTPEESPELLDNWAPTSDIEVAIQFQLDWAEGYRHLRLHPSAHLAAVASWRSTGVLWNGASDPKRVISDSTHVDLLVPGHLVGSDLRVTLDLVVLEPGLTVPQRHAPVEPGAIVWRESRRVVLEGDASQLPVEAHDFAQVGLAASAVWYLEVLHRELEAPAGSALRLWLNTANPAAAAMLDRNSPGRDNLRRVVTAEVARQMTTIAIQIEELDISHTYPEGSLGATLVPYVTALGTSPELLRGQLRDAPTALESRIQSHAWGIA